MNNILDLIKNEKVEWKKLGDIKEINIVLPNKKLKKQEYLSKGKYPIIDQGQKFIIGYTNDESAVFDKNLYVIFGDHTETLKYVDFQFAQGAEGIKVMKTDEKYISSKYLFYSISNFYKTTKQYKRHFSTLKETIIPIPSFKTQQKIVAILDKFTSYINELQKELKIELQNHNKQYEYYKDMLLSKNYLNKLISKDNNEIIYKKLEDIGIIYSGLKSKTKKDFINGNYKYISYKHIFNNDEINLKKCDKVYIGNENQNKVKQGDIFFTASSEILEECGKVSVMADEVNEDVYLNSFCFGFRINQGIEINPKYLRYFLTQKDVRKQIIKTASGVTRYNISKEKIRKIDIIIPPINIQLYIVSILDKLNNIINDNNISIPKEINLRNKQYEYYRDRLLNI